MKHVIVAILLFALIYYYGQVTNDYLKQFLIEIQDQMGIIHTLFLQDEWAGIEKEFEDVHQKWEENKKKLAFLIDHEDANHLEVLIGRIEAEIQMKNEHLLPDIAELIHRAQQIIEKYDFSWGNIF